MDPSVKENLVKSSNAFNSISLISSFLVLASFSIVALYRPRLINRTTLRLQAAISLFDFLNAFFALFHHSVKSGSFCTFIGFWRNFGEQMYCLLNIMIALNLQLIFLHNKMPNKGWEITYWASSLLVAFILSIVPLGNIYSIILLLF
ncbi:hypothetical protein K502DRAFT_355740 [Neoconidiobolus thromboides FSU 785]|nr:hypothetical protein K502DRAFT_355740 [Neoconidiobolus thromboides FSU 785]